MQYIQNSAARLITKKRKFDPISPILQELHWLPIKSQIKFKLLTIVFSCIQGSAPVYLQEIIQSYKPKRNLHSNSQNLLNQIRVRTKLFGDRAFAKAAPELWNSLPQSLRDITSLDQSKLRLKTFLFLNGYFFYTLIIDFGSYFSHSSYLHAYRDFRVLCVF